MADAKSKRVYHFCNHKYGLENIEKSRLKVATIMDLNDPFEMLCYSSRDSEIRRIIRKFKLDVAQKFGLLCFSKSFLSPVQWAHYSDKHRDICLAFDIPAEHLRTVEYRSGRIEFDTDKYSEMLQPSRSEFMERLFHVKHSQWRYEKEVRQVFLLSNTVKEGDYNFRPFSDIGTLSQVIVGCNSPVKRSDVEKALGPERQEVTRFKVRTAFKTYNIVRNTNASLWE
ncbi:hypothetical protein BOO88_19505 [Stutzerimonas stutzeri]|nr:hypothetical protein BOO89_27170 [Stutzerimonas stutzeri]AZO90985.1 hypothetical protein BOO88_19505 [Stutzerimonas stutzeri]